MDFEHTKLSGFSDDGRVKVLLLNLLPSGMTETAAQEIAKALQLNIYNTNHFTVVGPEESGIYKSKIVIQHLQIAMILLAGS